MKKQLVIIGIVAILVCVELSGCNEINIMLNPEKNKFVGTWQNKASDTGGIYYNTMILSLGDTGSLNGLSVTWDVKDRKLIIKSMSDSSSIPLTYTYMFYDNDRTLTLTDSVLGETMVWIKQ